MQEVIRDITKRMGEGMTKYVGKTELTSEQYEEYCYIVAGMVGEGLTRIFNHSELEAIKDPEFKKSIAMGKFLQKTNILRDFHEDYHEDRVFWPRDVCHQYCKDLGEFLDEPE